MSYVNWQDLIDSLRDIPYQFGVVTADSPVYRIEFEAGLTDAEVITSESRFCFCFPDDLRAFLQTALPIGPRFPNWRSDDSSLLQKWLDAPTQGILFDVEQNGVWLSEWGPRPASLQKSLTVCRQRLDLAPRLIPVYGHRMMPAEPRTAGNPVLSVHQTDVIFYGFDLDDYLRHEFHLPNRRPWPQSLPEIRFWSALCG